LKKAAQVRKNDKPQSKGELMKSIMRWTGTLACIGVTCWSFGISKAIAASREDAEAAKMMNNAEAERRAAAAARAKDPAWKPTSSEIGKIQVGDGSNPGQLRNFCLNSAGEILACFAPSERPEANSKKTASKETPAIRIYSPKGKLLNTLPLPIKPLAICVAKEGSIFVAGEGKLLKLNPAGEVLATVASPVADAPVSMTDEMDEILKESARANRRSLAEEKERMKEMLEQRRSEVTGLAVTDKDVFMAVPAPSDFTYRVYRFSHALKDPNLVVEKLRGCCGQMDIQAHNGQLWIPHNARHTIENRDRDGKEVAKFGTAGRIKASDFGGCCEPKNLRILPDGEILAAESGPPTCIKRFSARGKFLGVVAVTDGKGDCVRVTVERSPDKSTYYLLDTQQDAIRIFKAKG